MSVDADNSLPMLPDERVLRMHLAGGNFQSGVSRKRWRLIAIDWPIVILAVTAAVRDSSPSEYAFRFDCQNYPNDPPTARLWDADANAPLPAVRWPYGEDRFALAFNPVWQNGEALYLPCDRRSLAGHPAWPQQHPHLIWTPTKDITFYLSILYDYLHSRHYQGSCSPAP